MEDVGPAARAAGALDDGGDREVLRIARPGAQEALVGRSLGLRGAVDGLGVLRMHDHQRPAGGGLRERRLELVGGQRWEFVDTGVQ